MATFRPVSPLNLRKRVSMRDVAARCGVSISTVSLVLSGDARIPEDTTRMVLQTVKAMEYRPSVLARSLAKRGSRTLGVILPEWAFEKNQPYYYQALQGIHSETQPAGFKMLVEAASRGFLDRRYYLRLLKEQSVDGVLYMAAARNDGFLSEMKRENYPFVLLGGRVADSDLPFFGADDVKAAVMATQHLISLGHRTIGHVGGSPELSHGADREAGYRLAMAEAKLDVNPGWIAHANFDQKKAEAVVSSLLRHKITAVVAASDMMAYGVLRGLQKLNVRVPQDVAVMGIDDLEMSQWVNPSLSTIRVGISGTAAQAARAILKSIQTSVLSIPTENNFSELELIVRSSCGASK